MGPWGGRGRRLVVLAAGAAVSAVALTVLGNWFPVSLSVLTAWAVLAFLDWGLPGAAQRSPAWMSTAGFALLFPGLGLLIGAASGSAPRDHVATGVVLGVVLFVLGTVIAVIGQRRFSARVVAAEIERHRGSEQSDQSELR